MTQFIKILIELIVRLFSKKKEDGDGDNDSGQTIDTAITDNGDCDCDCDEEIITGTTYYKKMVELKLIRTYFGSNYTIGKLYVNGEYFCDTLEDKDRGLTSDMSNREINLIKIKNETAIPYGKYEVTLSVQSPKYSDYNTYPWAKRYNAFIPRLIEVPGFDGILIHPGNDHTDTSGCILCGKNTQKGMVTSSQKTFFNLMDEILIPGSEGGITIEIIK